MAFARSVRVSRRYATCQIENHQTSDALPGTVRSFASYRAIATEAGLSRIYAGQHTPLDVWRGSCSARRLRSSCSEARDRRISALVLRRHQQRAATEG